MKKYASALLLCLLIVPLCYSLPGPEDSVKVPIRTIYYYNAVADSNDECQANKVRYEKAISEADSVIQNRGRIIASLTKQNNGADLIIEQKDIINKSLKADVSKLKTQRTFIGAVLIAFITVTLIK